MNLSKLEIAGFKSFMSRLELDFSSGITAILGPNGCGKSNVVDSIRWVLGEQRTRMLRNSKMENVIFNGTRLRKPVGMAEVYMTLTNEDHTLDLDFDEVRIGRRLYRNGTSEYLVNGEPSRLKSIKGLLTDTGLGNNAYSIIERDMVERVLSEKGNEKRNLLEEAAGVSRYRIQREEAERKIKATEQDLLRLADILTELDKELRSLKYQMAKARRYSRLKEQADALESVQMKQSLYELLQRKLELQNERKHHEGIQLADDNEISIRDNRVQELKVNLAESETKLQEHREQRYEVSSKLQSSEEKIAVHTERIGANRARISEGETEIRTSEEKLLALADDRKHLDETLATKREELANLQEGLDDRERELREATSRLEQVRTTLRDRKQLALDLVRERAKETGLREQMEKSINDLTEKREASSDQLESLARDESERAEKLASAESVVEERKAELEGLEHDIVRVTKNLEELTESGVALDAEHAEASRRHAKLVEKQNFLAKVKQEHTRWSAEALKKHEKLSGVLADFVRVDKRYRKCIEACLAPVLKSVVAGSRSDAMESLREIRGDGGTRVQILFPDSFGGGSLVPQRPEVVARAASLVNCDEDVREFMDGYLGDVFVVEDLDAAARLLADHPRVRVATLDGVFFDGPGRVITAGAEDIDMTILEYEAKIEELEASLAEATEAETAIGKRREQLFREREAAQSGLGKLRERRSAVAESLETARTERRDAELALVRTKEQITSVTRSVDDIDAELTTIRVKLQEHERSAGAAVPADLEGADLGELEAKATELERERERLTEVAGRARIDHVTLTGEVESHDIKLRNNEKLDEELKALIQSRKEDVARCREQIALSEEDVARMKSIIAELHTERDGIEKVITEKQEAADTFREQMTVLEKELKEFTDQRDAKRTNLERVSIEMATVDTKVAGVVERARDTFNQDLESFVSNPEKFDTSEWEAFNKEELIDVRKKLESFGPVNMLALEEHDEKKERFDFLQKQKDDLEEAKNSLVQAIRRINKEARRLLAETFEQVRDNFRQTFLTLFDGGEVDLLFVDSDDPLEANIKIVASPKGKRLNDISVLSSGERALVALSLLFGVYLVKPSPFCVFDEVDAPLDDANIARFVRLLKSFTDRTQFIVITHNKKTMEAADNLYGVTMEEPGVSKLISIRLDEAERFNRRKPATEAAS